MNRMDKQKLLDWADDEMKEHMDDNGYRSAMKWLIYNVEKGNFNIKEMNRMRSEDIKKLEESISKPLWGSDSCIVNIEILKEVLGTVKRYEIALKKIDLITRLNFNTQNQIQELHKIAHDALEGK
jgi:hypothetical protein